MDDHLAAALAAAGEVQRRVGEIAAARFVLEGFWQAVGIAALTHDLGKVADGFQDMVLGTGLRRGWGHRHELLSLGFLPGLLPDDGLRDWVSSAVATHHRPLRNDDRSLRALYGGMPIDDLRDDLGPINEARIRAAFEWTAHQLARLGITAGVGATAPDPEQLVITSTDVFRRICKRWAAPVARETGLVAVLLQGALTFADHLSSAHGSLHTHQPIGSGFPKLLDQHLGSREVYPHQAACADITGHLLLRSPTGSGKTEGSLLWSARQVEDLAAATGGVPRVFLTLPYLASINAMAGRLGSLVGDDDLVGVAHSRAASYHLATSIGVDDGETDTDRRGHARKAVSRTQATRLFRETIRVTTPYQLLRAALAGPAYSSVLVDLANSVIVMDELHAYDPRRLGYILANAKLWEQLGCRIAVLSATLPRALADLVRETLDAKVTEVPGPVGNPRHRVRVREHALTDPASIAEITANLAAGRSVLVVANNVAHAQQLFDDLAPVATDLYGEDGAVLLHSRFKRVDRNRIEDQLSRRYGSEVPVRRPGLVIATQVIEVSLDIDRDVLYTAGAPLEALLQRFGRVNRRGDRPPCDVTICQPRYAPRRRQPNGPDYADGVYEAAPVQHAMRILTHHDGQTVDELAATEWLDEIYRSDWGKDWHAEVIRHRDEFTELFLDFTRPFDGRGDVEETFDRMFEGTEAILSTDTDEYAELLGERPDAAGRLLGEDLLIPLPHWATALTSYERRWKVRVIDGDYDPRRGLLSVKPVAGTPVYQPGEVF